MGQNQKNSKHSLLPIFVKFVGSHSLELQKKRHSEIMLKANILQKRIRKHFKNAFHVMVKEWMFQRMKIKIKNKNKRKKRRTKNRHQFIICFVITYMITYIIIHHHIIFHGEHIAM